MARTDLPDLRRPCCRCRRTPSARTDTPRHPRPQPLLHRLLHLDTTMRGREREQAKPTSISRSRDSRASPRPPEAKALVMPPHDLVAFVPYRQRSIPPFSRVRQRSTSALRASPSKPQPTPRRLRRTTCECDVHRADHARSSKGKQQPGLEPARRTELVRSASLEGFGGRPDHVRRDWRGLGWPAKIRPRELAALLVNHSQPSGPSLMSNGSSTSGGPPKF